MIFRLTESLSQNNICLPIWFLTQFISIQECFGLRQSFPIFAKNTNEWHFSVKVLLGKRGGDSSG